MSNSDSGFPGPTDTGTTGPALSLKKSLTASGYRLLAIQDLTYFCGQGFLGERFLDEVDTLLQHAVTCDDIGRIAGREQAFDSRANGIEASHK
jgi:hypothetical protein